jgi:serine phosphatase RsbU (regulator of sigma subunit)
MTDDTRQTQLDEMTAELLDRYEELTLLYDLGASLASVLDVDESCAIAVEKAARAVGASWAIVALEGDDGVLYPAAMRGTDRLSPGGITEHVATTGRELLLHEGEPAPEGVSRDDADDGAVLSVPLLPPGAAPALGALTLAAKPAGDRFTSGDAKLANAVATQLAAAVQRSRLVASLRASEAVRREVEIAARIQRSLLPGAPPEIRGATVAALCVPAANVGGDYYDFFVDDRGRVSLVIADVAGHSIGSALMMAMARTILRRELHESSDPAAVVTSTNAALFDDLVRSSLFLTVFCVRFDPAAGVLEYANAGHNPPLLRRASGEVSELDADGAAVGILRDVEFERGRAELARGDVVLLYTDGVTEAARADGAQFGEDGLREIFGDLPPQELVDTVFSAARAHAGVGSSQGDDITLVALRADGLE